MRSRAALRRRLALAVVSGALLAGTIATPALAAPDFTIDINPASQTLTPGTSVSFVIGIGQIDDFSDPVSLSVSGLPPTVTASFSTNPVTPPGTSFLLLTAADDAEEGSFALAVTATGGGITHVADGQATVDFGLVPVCYGAVEGTVTDDDTNLPIGGVTISTSPQIVTDAAGHYLIEGVPLDQNNSPTLYPILARKDPDYWWKSLQPIIFCEETTRLDFAMVPIHPARVSGLVVVGNIVPPDYETVIPTSTPIEGARVCVSTPLCQVDPTGPDGAFDITFPLGYENQPFDAFLEAYQEDASSPTPWRTGYWYELLPMGTMDPDEHLVQDIALVAKCTGSISVTAVYADTNEPAVDVHAGAFLGFIDADQGRTDDQGEITFPELLLAHNNAPASYAVYSNDGGGPFTNVTLDECGDHADAHLVLQRPRSATIEGFVLDEDTREPIEGAYVTWCLSCPSVLTDDAGHYELPIPLGFTDDPQDISVLAGKDPYWPQEQAPVIEDLLPNQVRSAPDILLLLRRHAGVTGIVRDAITHEPIPGAGVVVLDGVSTGDVTDQDGRYEIQGVPLAYRNEPWEPTVQAMALGYWFSQATVEVRADETSVLDLELLPICEDATISGRVVNAVTLEPIEGAFISGAGATTTDANGEYLLEHVQVGVDNTPIQVQLTASAPGFHAQTKRVTVFCGGSIFLDFGPEEPRSSIEGYVTDETNGSPGDPMPGVLIGGAFGQTTLTDDRGHYRFDGVPLNADGSPRTWELTAFPEEFDQDTRSVEVRANEVARLDFTFRRVTSTGTIVVRKVTVPTDDPATFSFGGAAEGTIGDGGEIRVTGLTPGEYRVSEIATNGWVLTGIDCDDAVSQTPSSGDVQTATAAFGLDAGETVTCVFTNSSLADGVSITVKTGRTAIYTNFGTLTSGDYVVSPPTGALSSIVGIGSIPSSSGNGSASISLELLFDAATRRWSGAVSVDDPGAGFTAVIPVTAGRAGISRSETTVTALLKGIRAQSLPRSSFTVVVTIDDLV